MNLSPHVRVVFEFWTWGLKSKERDLSLDMLYIIIIRYFVVSGFIFPKSKSSMEKKTFEPTSLTEVLCLGIDWINEAFCSNKFYLESPTKNNSILCMGLAKSSTSMFTLNEYYFLTKGLYWT